MCFSRHPEVRAQRASKDDGHSASAASFEARATRGHLRMTSREETIMHQTKPRLTTAEYANRFEAETVAQRRQARLCLPRDFFDGTADRYVIGELKRLRKAGKLVQDGDNVHTLRLRLVEAGR